LEAGPSARTEADYTVKRFAVNRLRDVLDMTMVIAAMI
jgi:hypothetical protein